MPRAHLIAFLACFTLLGNACQSTSESAHREIEAGLKSWGAGDKLSAKDHFDKAAAIDQYAVLAYDYRSILEDDAMQSDQVIQDIDHLISIGYPVTLELLTRRGDAYAHKGDYARALADYQQIIHLMPDDYRGYMFTAGAYEGSNDLPHALQACQIALQKIQAIDPATLALIYYEKGTVLVRMGNPEQGRADIARARELYPDLIHKEPPSASRPPSTRPATRP